VFFVSPFVEAELEKARLSPRQVANLSGWLRENPRTHLTRENIGGLLQLPTLTVAERAEKLLAYLARTYPKPHREIKFGIAGKMEPEMFTALISISWSEDLQELQYYVWHYLTDTKGFLRKLGDSHIITSKGWDYLDSLKRNKDSKLVFVAMSFKEELKFLFDDCIRPAVKDAGYNAERVDTEHHVENINDRMIALINRSRFVVADFTLKSHGVYFEAGYARGLGLTVIWSCREDEVKNLHFDASPFNMLTWTTGKLADYRERLKDRIGAVIR
jgi:hypothetical protein